MSQLIQLSEKTIPYKHVTQNLGSMDDHSTNTYCGYLVTKHYKLSYFQYLITLVSCVGEFHDPRICQLYYVGPSNMLEIFPYYLHIELEHGNLGGVGVHPI